MTSHTLLQEIGLIVHFATQPAFFWLVCAIGIGWLVYAKKYREALVITLSIITTSALITVLKYSFAVTRPDSALVALDTYSFPSGHAGSSATIAVVLVWLLFSRMKTARTRIALSVVIISLALLVAISRVLIDVHTVTDVLVGALIGLCIPLFYISLLAKAQKNARE